MKELNAAEFDKHLNSKFKFYRTEDEIFEGELVEVLELKANDNLYSFSIVFSLPADFGLEQKLYKIEHPQMEPMELFIVPVGQNEAGIRYEAIFSRIVRNN